MKTVKLDVIKKNRVYFACKNEQGYSVKLRITPESMALTVGQHELLVNDVSVRSKFGVDVIYEMVADAKEDGVATLRHFMYNADLIEKCRKLGGRWDGDEKAWVFPGFVSDKVEELDEIYNDELITIELKAKEYFSRCNEPILFCGYVVARATGRDSGAKLGEGVSMLQGSVGSSGSMKNWATCIQEGTIIRLNVPARLYRLSFLDYEDLFEIELV